VADPGFGLGVALGDYNGDGAVDIFVVNASKTSALFRNNGFGTFVNQTRPAGLLADGSEAAVWGDYDNDGFLDLYVVRILKPSLLYRNLGNGTFVDVAFPARVTNEEAGRSAAWGDFDNDGYLDLFVANAGPDRLYHNNGNGTFSEISLSAGLENPTPSTGGIWGDFNNDGYLDLLVTHFDNRLSPSNLLYYNNHNRTFAGLQLGQNGLGATTGDYDNDGDLDIFMISILSPPGFGEPVLFRNNGDGAFTDVTESAGLSSSVASRSAAWGDFDNDGWLDIYLLSGSEARQIFRNDGDGTFSDISDSAGVAGDALAKALASGDFDNDGDLDIYVANEGKPNVLYQNQGRGNNWLMVKTEGRISNRAGIGARVRLIAGALSQTREVSGGSGFRSQDSLPVEFGLGKRAMVDTLRIYWPSGIVDTYAEIRNINRIFEAKEGLSVSVDTMTANAGLPIDYSLSQNFPNPAIQNARAVSLTTLRYALPKPGKVSLKIYNILGQEIFVLEDKYQTAGFHTVYWNGRDKNGIPVRSGIYFYQLKSGGHESRKKMIVLGGSYSPR
jgi:hypothetical protein